MPQIYQQSAVIPYRVRGGDIEVLLITSADGKRWGIPKGLVEPDMTPAESAANEAYEEAGVKGRVASDPIGTFDYCKWGGRCEVEVYPMHVDRILDDWPESAVRRRKWHSVTKAANRVSRSAVRNLLLALHQFV